MNHVNNVSWICTHHDDTIGNEQSLFGIVRHHNDGDFLLGPELPETIVELRSVAESLTKGAALDEAAFAALDRVCEAADATASAAFRRLRRI